jgi:outer membrane protein assembly factor BamB
MLPACFHLRRLVMVCGLCLTFSLATLASQTETNRSRENLPTNSWPQWRGPLATGVSPQANPPVRWSETNHVRWKTPLPGKGHSTPIVAGDFLYLTAAIPIGDAQAPVYDNAPGTHDNAPVTHHHQFVVIAVHRRDGRIAWQKTLREEFPHEGGHVTGSLASNSPVTDGERIHVFFGSRGLYTLDREGTVLWKKDLGRMETLHAHGEGSSPVLYHDSLIVCWDHEGQSALYRYDKKTGRQIWKVDRDEKTSWSTPLVVEHDGRPQIIISATKRVRAYDFADGRLLWECAGLSRNVVSSPVAGFDMVFAGNSYDWQAMLAIRLRNAKGDVTETDRVAWKLNRLTPYVSSPLLYGDTLYFLRHNQNILSRLDPLTGEFRGEPIRLAGIRDFIFASPVGAANRIYVASRDGATVVLEHSRENAVLAVNQLDDSFSASPALAGRDLYLRGEKHLYCLSEIP